MAHKRLYKNNKSSAFQFYPSKWLSGVAHLSHEGYVAYHKILCWMWLHSKSQYTMDDTTEVWADATGMNGKRLERVRRELMKPGFQLLQKRGSKVLSRGLKKEHQKQRAWRIKSSMGGKKSAERRYGKNLQGKGGDKGGYEKKQPKGNTTSTTPTVVDYVGLPLAAPPPEGGGGAAGLREATPPDQLNNILSAGGGLLVAWGCPRCTVNPPPEGSTCFLCNNTGKMNATSEGRSLIIKILYDRGILKASEPKPKLPRTDSRGEYLGTYGTDLAPDKTDTDDTPEPDEAPEPKHSPPHKLPELI